MNIYLQFSKKHSDNRCYRNNAKANFLAKSMSYLHCHYYFIYIVAVIEEEFRDQSYPLETNLLIDMQGNVVCGIDTQN